MLLLAGLPIAAAPMRRADPGDLIFTEVTPSSSDAANVEATVDAFGDAASQEPPASNSAPRKPVFKVTLPRGSMRATLKRLGLALPPDDDEVATRGALLGALQTVKMPLLRGLLFERGGRCAGCTERSEFMEAVLKGLDQPLVARHALPLFIYDAPLYPLTSTGLHLFEPRYKLLCRKALKADRYFGFVREGVGTLAKITAHRFTDDDAADGTCHLTVAGSRRFRLHKQWADECAGCTSGPLHYADVVYFNDTQPPLATPAKEAAGVSMVKDAVRLHHALVSSDGQRKIEEQIGATPTTRDRGFAMSWWLAAACVATLEGCKSQAAEILQTRSTRERMEMVIQVQKKAVDKKHRRRGG